jgi:SAM-dependent methyltransferase
MITPVAAEFRCPACGGTLHQHEGFACGSCARTFVIRDGIVDFRVENRDYYFNPVPPEEMQRLIRDMDVDGWARTVAGFVRHTAQPRDWIDNLTADGRYAWKVLLDLRPETVLLDLGCGLGNLSFNLAPHVARLYAMDLTWERIAFARRRFEGAGDRDHVVALAGGDGTHLPFPDGALDCVVLSGVLEWVGEAGTRGLDDGGKLVRAWRMARSAFGAGSPREVQRRFLLEVRRVLKPAGQLFIAIENRTSYRYFLGDADHHSGLRFSSLLPRPLANLYSIWAARRPYRTYTYSVAGYRRLLREAGFTQTEFFGLFPGYSHMRQIVPVDGRRARWRSTPERRARARLARNRYVVPAYGIVAGAEGRAPSLLDAMVASVESTLRPTLGPGRVEIHDLRVTAKDKGLLTARYGARPILIKVPFGAPAIDGEAANARFLTRAKDGFAHGLSIVPHHRGSGEVRNLRYFVEDRRPGSPLHHEIARLGASRALPLVEALLQALNPSPGAVGGGFDGEAYDRRVTRRLKVIAPLVGDPGLCAALDDVFRDRLYGTKLPCGVEHGDFAHDNILVGEREVCGLVDWEGATFDGIPLLDVLSYVEASRRIDEPGLSLKHTIPALARGEGGDRGEWAFIERQYRRLGVDLTYHDSLVCLYWLQHVSGLVAFGLGYERARIEADVLGVARQVVEGWR